MKSDKDPFRQMLRERLEERCQRNPRYSLRSFARDLGIAPSRLSEVLGGKRGFSKTSATLVAKKLGLNATEARRFALQIEATHSRSPRLRSQAQAALYELESANCFNTLQLDAFKVISDWYHYAILETTYLEDFESTANWIAKRLGITHVEASMGIERLKRVGLLVENEGKLQAAEEFTASTSGIPSEMIRKFHSQILEKAQGALVTQSVEERDFSCVTFALDPDRLPEMKDAIKTFRRELGDRTTRHSTKNRVYCMAVQFFALDQVSPDKPLTVSSHERKSL